MVVHRSFPRGGHIERGHILDRPAPHDTGGTPVLGRTVIKICGLILDGARHLRTMAARFRPVVNDNTCRVVRQRYPTTITGVARYRSILRLRPQRLHSA
ncbi:hypothetical protein KCP78_08065 [Salmonella enterica subsp. enterica]|nr:hypothetical protein KCP78_08065 [Salmonella enterica subsp. enterica]